MAALLKAAASDEASCIGWGMATRVLKPRPVPEKQSLTAPEVLEKVEEKFGDKYVVGKQLGKGRSGIVYECQSKDCEEAQFAVKVVGAAARVEPEVRMLKRLAHPCIVKLHDVYYEEQRASLVMQHFTGGDLVDGMHRHLENKSIVALSSVRRLSKMMTESVAWCHQNAIVHRDLKGDNYLLDRSDINDPNCRLVLSDFETATSLKPGQRLNERCGTDTYWAPEFYDLDYGLAVDMWALGVITYGLVFKTFPFKGEEDCKTKPVKYPTTTSNDGRAFIKATLNRDEGKRLTAQQALSHSFLSCKPHCSEKWLSEKTEQCSRWTTKKADMVRDFCRQPRL